MLQDALDIIPEDTEAKQLRLADMIAAEERGEWPASYVGQRRWIGARASTRGPTS